MKIKAAIASTDLKNVDIHFGRCRTFAIAEVDCKSRSYRLIEQRDVTAPCPSCGRLGEPDDAIENVVESLSDCEYVIVSRIGRWPDSLLYERGIGSIEHSGPIRDAMALLFGRLRARPIRSREDVREG
jgi:predicted Fe-Mo cluster-binding NifX family protein